MGPVGAEVESLQVQLNGAPGLTCRGADADALDQSPSRHAERPVRRSERSPGLLGRQAWAAGSSGQPGGRWATARRPRGAWREETLATLAPLAAQNCEKRLRSLCQRHQSAPVVLVPLFTTPDGSPAALGHHTPFGPLPVWSLHDC